jgi:hypothetical protein
MTADRFGAIVEPFSIGRSQAVSCDFEEKFLKSENGRTLIAEIWTASELSASTPKSE